ncbi:alpha/beta-hydrolase [Rhizodiscina lignyota]|uniref:Alpha/beta-hydrolase n=1 Tax=Rhizodiscina lignyota TaxID=1504668 RepID=A0A9P4M6G4_9PEZI|nr:alpha/beta-hydrolase [Rhizodiscina lignyota]
MHCFLYFSFLPILLAQAHRIHTEYTPPNANCIDYEIPVVVSTKGVEWIGPKRTDNYGLIDFVFLSSTRPEANFTPPVTGPVDINGTYTISGTFCSPKTKCEHSNTVLLATHGLGYDRSYWNSAFEPEKYNFAQYAVDKGYSIFFYDRLGTGRSSKLSGFVNQISIQVSILAQLAAQIKAGQYTDTIGPPKKLVLVGHSFGSFTTQGLVAAAPEIADAVILTGIGFTMQGGVVIESFDLRVAALKDKKWKGLDNGYVIWDDVYANVNVFFKAPLYTIEAVAFSEKNKVPFAITELITIPTLNYTATGFKGNVLYFNGEYDIIACGGYCPGVEQQPHALFSGSKAFQSKLQPNTGHGLNGHKNATAGYKVITDYLMEQGF